MQWPFVKIGFRRFRRLCHVPFDRPLHPRFSFHSRQLTGIRLQDASEAAAGKLRQLIDMNLGVVHLLERDVGALMR